MARTTTRMTTGSYFLATPTKQPPATTTIMIIKRGMKIGRMLDMGGAPSAGNDQSLIRTHQASKNSKLQAVAFDFHCLTTSLEQKNNQQQQPTEATQQNNTSTTTNINKSEIQPDLGMIENVANLLNVSIDTKPKENNIPTTPKEAPSPKPVFNPTNDIRAKYAHKLKGGLAGIELAKSEVQESLQKGDAAGHLAARKIAAQTAASGSKWMALTGTGKLLSYLTHRSIQIALLDTKPNPQMKDFAKQLPEVVIDVMFDHGFLDDDAIQQKQPTKEDMDKYMKTLLSKFNNQDPHKTLVVSDRDDYLRAARDLGMMTCRLQPKNARRGNLTCNYTVPSILEVQDVVNEINGISFNVTLNR
jgi:FMN phosphatase YigB (HAD superfamily)